MRIINCSNDGILRINKRLIVIPNATPIIRFKIDLEEGNLNNIEMEDTVNHGPTIH